MTQSEAHSVRLCSEVPESNHDRGAAWRKRYKATGRATNALSHWIRTTHGVDFDERKEDGRIDPHSYNDFLPIKEK